MKSRHCPSLETCVFLWNKSSWKADKNREKGEVLWELTYSTAIWIQIQHSGLVHPNIYPNSMLPELVEELILQNQTSSPNGAGPGSTDHPAAWSCCVYNQSCLLCWEMGHGEWGGSGAGGMIEPHKLHRAQHGRGGPRKTGKWMWLGYMIWNFQIIKNILCLKIMKTREQRKLITPESWHHCPKSHRKLNVSHFP